jgi:uncharacterized protein YndB with AHSA1/START domain
MPHEYIASGNRKTARADHEIGVSFFAPAIWQSASNNCLEAMIRTQFKITVDIAAPPPLVWSVLANVERWPGWAPSISRVKKLSAGPLQVGSRVRVHQPKLPPAFWRVTELNPGADFTWISRAPGVRVTARHEVAAAVNGSYVTLSIRYEGLLGGLLARCTGNLNEDYLAVEAGGLKAQCTELAAKLNMEHHETH